MTFLYLLLRRIFSLLDSKNGLAVASARTSWEHIRRGLSFCGKPFLSQSQKTLSQKRRDDEVVVAARLIIHSDFVNRYPLIDHPPTFYKISMFNRLAKMAYLALRWVELFYLLCRDNFRFRATSSFVILYTYIGRVDGGWKTPLIINSKFWPQVQVTAKEILLHSPTLVSAAIGCISTVH